MEWGRGCGLHVCLHKTCARPPQSAKGHNQGHNKGRAVCEVVHSHALWSTGESRGSHSGSLHRRLPNAK